MDSTFLARRTTDNTPLLAYVRAGSLLMLGMAVIVLVRQSSFLAGETLGVARQCAVAGMLVLTAGLLRILMLATIPGGTQPRAMDWQMPGWAGLLVTLTAASPAAGIGAGMAWSVWIASELGWSTCWIVRSIGARRASDQERPILPKVVASEATSAPVDTCDNPAAANAEQELDQILPADTSLKLSRSTSAEGDELLEALMRVTFQPGQRSQFAHLQIHPALQMSPQVLCHQLSGPGCTIKVSDALKIGIRLEIRLGRVASQTEQVVFHLEATTAVQQRAA